MIEGKGEKKFPYASDVVYKAVVDAHLAGFTLVEADESNRTVIFKNDAFFFGWGQNIRISLEAAGAKNTCMHVLITPRGGKWSGGILLSGHYRKLIDRIFNAVSNYLRICDLKRTDG